MQRRNSLINILSTNECLTLALIKRKEDRLRRMHQLVIGNSTTFQQLLAVTNQLIHNTRTNSQPLSHTPDAP